MKKQFFIPACALAAAAIGFVMYAVGHPELSFSWSIQMTHILYGLYVDAVVLLFVLAFWKKTDSAYIPVVLLELGAVFFLVQSMMNIREKACRLVLRRRCTMLLYALSRMKVYSIHK